MNALAQVPAWFWVAWGTVVALAALVAGAWGWKHRRRPKHRIVLDRPTLTPGKQTFEYLPAVTTAFGYLPVAEVNGKPPWELAHEPTAAEVAASRAAHGYIPELDPDADDLGPGAGFPPFTGYNSHLFSDEGAKVDSPALDDLPREDGGTTHSMIEWATPATGAGESEDYGLTALPAPTRLLRTTGELFRADLLADATAFMARQDTDVLVWLAGARERWAAA